MINHFVTAPFISNNFLDFDGFCHFYCQLCIDCDVFTENDFDDNYYH